MSCCNSNCNHDPCGSSFNQALTKAGQYAQYAQTQANKAEDLWLEFNALYLGAFAVAPTQDNQGNPLQVGALYWNTASNELYTWTGLAWYLAPGFDEFTPFLSTGSTTPRNLATRMADVVNVKDFGAVGDGVTDDTAAIQAAYNTGKSVFHPNGNYIISALTLSASNVILFGRGVLVKKAGVDGVGITITGSNNIIDGLNFDGTASVPTPNYLNNIIEIRNPATNNTIKFCNINGSKGGGITIFKSGGNKIIGNTIKNTRDNNIIVANAGADNNIISNNYCVGTTVQNNIFITASADSSPNGEYVYGNIITGNYCADSADTCIESGYHAQRTLIANNVVTNSVNPPLLVRDGFGIQVTSNIVLNKSFASQIATYDGIAIVPQNEPFSYSQQTKISDNIIIGAVKRSAIYIGGSNVDVNGNLMFDNNTVIGANGSGLVGNGIVIASTDDINVTNNTIQNYAIAINLNWENNPKTISNIEVKNNKIKKTSIGINCYDITFASPCSINNNTIKTVSTNAINLSLATVNGSLKFIDNDIDLTGFTGVSPIDINPVTADRVLCVITDIKTKVLTVPEIQFESAVILSGGRQAAGICTIQFADGSQIATFAVGGPSSAGTGTTIKTIGTSGLLDSSGSGGFANWSLFYDPSDNLVLQRRGTNTGSSTRYMKCIVRDAG